MQKRTRGRAGLTSAVRLLRESTHARKNRLHGWGGRIRTSAFRFSPELPSLNLPYGNSADNRAAYAVLSASTGVLGLDDDHSECKVSNPATSASQSGLRRPTGGGPSNPRGTAAFRRYRLVSVSRIGLQKRQWGPWSPSPVFRLSFLLDLRELSSLCESRRIRSLLRSHP
jgi:hypothetical protein